MRTNKRLRFWAVAGLVCGLVLLVVPAVNTVVVSQQGALSVCMAAEVPSGVPQNDFQPGYSWHFSAVPLALECTYFERGGQARATVGHDLGTGFMIAGIALVAVGVVLLRYGRRRAEQGRPAEEGPDLQPRTLADR